jgi:hypothetical protein
MSYGEPQNFSTEELPNYHINLKGIKSVDSGADGNMYKYPLNGQEAFLKIQKHAGDIIEAERYNLAARTAKILGDNDMGPAVQGTVSTTDNRQGYAMTILAARHPEAVPEFVTEQTINYLHQYWANFEALGLVLSGSGEFIVDGSGKPYIIDAHNVNFKSNYEARGVRPGVERRTTEVINADTFNHMIDTVESVLRLKETAAGQQLMQEILVLPTDENYYMGAFDNEKKRDASRFSLRKLFRFRRKTL